MTIDLKKKIHMKVNSKKNSWTKTECQIAYDEGCIQRKINFDQV